MACVLSMLIVLSVAAGMEGVAWFTHKYVMHGFLWLLHRDHYNPKGRGLQKNDLFAVFFGTISFLLILRGVITAAGAGDVGFVAIHKLRYT